MASVKSPLGKGGLAALGAAVLVLAAVLCLLFYKAFLPDHILFSNDGPLGAQNAECHHVPEGFSGGWQDLNSIGFREAGAFPGITFALLWVLGPVAFSKAYAAIALFILGLGAWTFFRQLRFAQIPCILAAIAAVLNGMFFSIATWGVAAQAVTLGMVFFALAALADTTSPRRWLRLVIAGLAVGMAVAEGADVGAIFSIYVAIFVLYQAWTTEGSPAMKLSLGVARVAVVAVFAALLAAHTISVLVGTQIKGVAGAQQDTQSKWERWDWATQWSLPKREAVGLIIPGVFGYRMDTPIGLTQGMQESYKGGQYWGFVGMDPSWYRFWKNEGPRPGGSPRGFSGGGFYAGTLVALVAVWAALQSFRKRDSAFPDPTRRLIWFWVAVVVISLPLSFGRFAPFYQIFYALPYSSTIRNPGKFLFPLSWAIVILFGYGINGLWRRYMETPAGTSAMGLMDGFKAWWRQTKGFDKRWALWSFAALAAGALGWLIYASSRQSLEQYLQKLDYDPAMVPDMAGFSIGQVGRFVLYFAIAVALMTLVLSGALSGRRAKWGGLFLGIFLVVDLGRANQPWIIVWDYKFKYATDPVVEFLRNKPYEHRVAIFPKWLPQFFNLPAQLASEEGYLAQYYTIEWAQHHFLYYDVQSLDVVQMPRMPEDLLAYEMNFSPRSSADLGHIVTRKWELTNTRYILAAADFQDVLNRFLDPGKQRFRIAERFNIVPKEGLTKITELQQLTAVLQTNGPYALFDFTGALPRAKLYSQWEMATNDQQMVTSLIANAQILKTQAPTNGAAEKELQFLQHVGTNEYLTLKKLASPAFDPSKTVLLAAPLPIPGTNAPADNGKVEITSYAPKDIELKAESPAPSVLLLNDRYDPNWKVTVDGKPEALLRCNYIMRGVFLPPGTHTVAFRFRPPMDSFYISLAGVALGILLCGVLLVWPKPAETEPVSSPGPQPRASKATPVGRRAG